jgi:predicted tellurium resistance membrane protein TerC
MDWLTNPESWIALATLTALEIVLGIDNIIFISILASKLPATQQSQGRRLGLLAALVTRIALLSSSRSTPSSRPSGWWTISQ